MTPQSYPMLSPSPRPRQYRPPQAINPRQPSRLPHLLLRPQPKARSPSFLLPLSLPAPLLRPRIPSTPPIIVIASLMNPSKPSSVASRLSSMRTSMLSPINTANGFSARPRKSHDRQGVLKMLGYAEKVVRNTSAAARASA